MSNEYILAWDIGGAHLKAAYYHRSGGLLETYQWPTPLWQGLDHLDNAIREAKSLFKCHDAVFQVATTTAELVDIFSGRQEGINILSEILSRQNQNILFYAGKKGFIKTSQIEKSFNDIASANWHATTSYVASKVDSGVMIDIGSTTTDIIPFQHGKPINRGYTDHERLLSGELVYSGMVRTPVMALVDRLDFRGASIPIMAEHFSTTADVYRILGLLNEADDYMETSDGDVKSYEASARRLARMIAIDYKPVHREDIMSLAKQVSSSQLDSIERALITSLQDIKSGPEPLLIGAGSGRILISKLAERLNLPYRDFHSLLEVESKEEIMVANCATAVSLACLAGDVL